MGIGTCAGKPWGPRIWCPISSVFPNSAFEVVSIFHSLKALAQSCTGSTNTSFDETVMGGCVFVGRASSCWLFEWN